MPRMYSSLTVTTPAPGAKGTVPWRDPGSARSAHRCLSVPTGVNVFGPLLLSEISFGNDCAIPPTRVTSLLFWGLRENPARMTSVSVNGMPGRAAA